MDLGNSTVTILQAPLAQSSRDNSLYRDWDNATSTVVTGCSVQPVVYSGLGISFENNSDREFVSSKLIVWAPPGTSVNSEDRAIYNSQEYEISGRSEDWYDFDGVLQYISFTMLLRKG